MVSQKKTKKPKDHETWIEILPFLNVISCGKLGDESKIKCNSSLLVYIMETNVCSHYGVQ